jgi:hypothetical protein
VSAFSYLRTVNILPDESPPPRVGCNLALR